MASDSKPAWFTFVWRVENIVETLRCSNKNMSSPAFTTKTSFISEWKLLLEHSQTSEPRVGLYLQRGDLCGPPNACIDYTISMYSQDDEYRPRICKKKENVTFKLSEPKLVSIIQLSDIFIQILDLKFVKVNLTIKCDITIHPYVTTTELMDALALSEDFTKLLETKHLADLELRISKVSFLIHKIVIFARARMLAEYFEISEKQTFFPTIIQVTNIDGDVLKELIHFLYSGKIRTCSNNVLMNLGLIAERFAIPDLKGVLCPPIRKHMSFTKLCTVGIHFQWIVQRFTPDQSNEKIEHPPIYVSELNCMLIITLENSADGIWISLRKFSLLSTPGTIQASIRIELFGENRDWVSVVYEDWYAISAESKRLPRTIEFDNFLETYCLSKIIFEGKLTLNFHFILSDGQVMSDIEHTEIASDCEHFNRENIWALRKSLHDIRQQGCYFSDIKLGVGDNSVNAHRAILSARSPLIFKDEDVNNDFLKMDDMDDLTLNVITEYIYGAYYSDLPHDCTTLYAYSVKMSIDSLKERCTTCMLNHLSDENALEVFTLAEAYSDEKLKTSVRDFIRDHATKILERADWKYFCERRSDLASEIYQWTSQETDETE